MGKIKQEKKIRKRKNNKLIKEKKRKGNEKRQKIKKGLWVFVGAICKVQLRDESYA